jgi:hypothetical protein
MCVDAGYATQDVHAWVRQHPQGSWGPAGAARQPRTVGAVKGRDRDTALLLSVSKVDAGSRRRGLRVWSLGTPVAKGELYRWLKLEWPTQEALEIVAGYPSGASHLPQYGEEYFKQLTAERLVTRIVKGLSASVVGEGAGSPQRVPRLPCLFPSGGLDLRPRSVRRAPLAADGGDVGMDRGARGRRGGIGSTLLDAPAGAEGDPQRLYGAVICQSACSSPPGLAAAGVVTVSGRVAAMVKPEDILAFWFPAGLDANEDTHRRQFEWWFRGGADRAIVEQYQPVLEAHAGASWTIGLR